MSPDDPDEGPPSDDEPTAHDDSATDDREDPTDEERSDDGASMAEYDPETGERVAEGDGEASASAADGQKYCHACGTQISAGAKFCPDCGAQQDDASPAETGGDTREVDRVTAGIFAILLGGLGVHHFYLGNVGLGVLYLCFSWTFIPALVGIVEGIIYLTKTDEEFQRQYGGD